MIDVDRLRVRLDGETVLDDVSLRIVPGEVLAVLGPNGAGKSTLLHALCGDILPYTGTIHMEGRPLAQWRPDVCARRRAVLLQETPINFPFTAFEVALLGRLPHVRRAGQREDMAIASEALRVVGAEPLAGRLYPTLSGGERQRVQFARALTQIWEPQAEAPRYLFLDEPTANLDLAYQHRVLDIARRRARDGVAVLMIVHDLNLASLYADRLLLLDRGRIAANGTPGEVLDSTTIARVFGVRTMIVAAPGGAGPMVVPVFQQEGQGPHVGCGAPEQG